MKQRFLRTLWLRGGDSNCYPLLQFLFSTDSALSSNGSAIVKSDPWFLQTPCPHFSPPPLSQAVKVGVLGCLHFSIRSSESPPGQLVHQGGQGRPPQGGRVGGMEKKPGRPSSAVISPICKQRPALPRQPQPHTRGDSVFGRSGTLIQPPLFSGLNEGTAKTPLAR